MQDKIYKKAATKSSDGSPKAQILNTFNLPSLQSGLFSYRHLFRLSKTDYYRTSSTTVVRGLTFKMSCSTFFL